MDAMERDTGLVNRIEFMVRRFFERVGGAIDFALRRTGRSRTDLSALIPQIERAIETGLRRESSKIIAPNLIELRYDYETYTRMGQKRRDFLEQEIASSIYEYIYNRRYSTLDKMKVKIAYDAFTRGLEIKTNFGEGREAVVVKGGEAQPQVRKVADVLLRAIAARQEFRVCVSSDGEPVGIGRNVANGVIIKDPTVSNFHAALVLRPDGSLELADRASANGTYVNGVLLGSADKSIVRDGDLIRIGDVEMNLAISVKE